MNILVTGGTGFLGRHVVELLRARGDQVRELSRRSGGSVLDPGAVKKVVAGCDAVIHLAGRVTWGAGAAAADLFELHVEGTRNVFRAAKEAGVKRLVHVSTSGTVGISKDLDAVATEDSAYAIELARNWPYYLSKIFAEKVALEHDAVVVSPALLLGPGEAAANEIVARFISREVAAIPSGVVSFVDVRDAAAMTVAALDKGQPGRRYLLGTNMSFAELFAVLERVSGVSGPLTKIPSRARDVIERATGLLETLERAAGFTGEEAASLAMAGYSWAVGSERAKGELGFAPRPADETLAAAVEAVRSSEEPLEPAGVLSYALGRLHKITDRLAASASSRRAQEPPPEDEARPGRSS
jgi:dihydroflavonol-4-reductase